MDVRRNHASTSARTEGGLLPSDLLEKIRAADPDVPGLTDADFGLKAGERSREATTRSWNRLVGSWAALEAVHIGADENDPLVGPTRDRFLVPLFEELGFGRLPVARAAEIEGTSYPISHNWEGRVPVHLVGYGVELDSRTKGVRGAAGAAPHALVQEYLNRTDEALWGIVSNGRTLRLLRDSTSLTRQAYVEFDLESIFAGELYADFALLWSVLHRSRFEGEKPADCLLERWTKKAADDGTRALDKLRGGVEKAIETLGAGFLATKGNHTLVQALRSGELDSQDYYRELLRLVYRLIFLFTAEDRRDEETGRELLLDPAAPEEAAECYRRYYSTARLRSFAGRRRGSRHPDLWVGIRRVVAALGSDGAPSIALPALGSLLFGPRACPHLDVSELTNEALLDAVRALATIEEDRRLRLVDYRNLGAEELGGIYEGLLELHPRIELDANPPRFTLGTAAGNERKSTGSYYTPTSLISCLLDSALDPVVDAAVGGRSGPEAEAAILGMSVVDPAAGSGHFLIAAAHRLAKRLAAVRSGEGEPPPTQVRHALRDVIARCIYAVDINPMAVELCKVSLWLEALEPGRPLTFIDAHIKCGNSLLGATPELVSAGVPDSAFEPLAGDDKATVKEWKTHNRDDRIGQRRFFEGSTGLPTEALADEADAVDALADDSAEMLHVKVARYDAYLGSADFRRTKAAMDAWCAAFVARKVRGLPEITTATVRELGARGEAVPSATQGAVATLASQFGFFHWAIEFPAIYERGGFDIVLGNPPWEQVKLKEKEFFAERNSEIANAPSAAVRKKLIAALPTTNPELWNAFQDGLRRADSESHFLRNSGRFPLAGRGDINTYAVFAELMATETSSRGRCGAIVPTGVATYDTTRLLFSSWVSGRRLVALYDFENVERMFVDIDNRMRFCVLVIAGDAQDEASDLVALARNPGELVEPNRHYTLSPDEFALINPNTLTAPTFRSRQDASLAKAIYGRVPIMVRTVAPASNPWRLSFMQMFSMTQDSGSFHDEPQPGDVSLYEAKHIHQFDHRWGNPGDQPTLGESATGRGPAEVLHTRYTIDSALVDERLRGRWSRDWLMGWRNITNTTNERTVIAAMFPRAGAGNSLYLAMSDAPAAPFLVANLNSFVLDWVARQSLGGTNLNLFIAQQLPLLPPESYDVRCPWDTVTFAEWLRLRFTELTYTATQMRSAATDLGYFGPPFRWGDRRQVLRAEVDAAYACLYGLTREDLGRVLDAFPIIREREVRDHGGYRTKELVLECFDRMATASPAAPFRSTLTPPPGHPDAAYPPGPDQGAGHWIPWPEVLAQAPSAPPTARSDRTVGARLSRQKPSHTSGLAPQVAPSLFAPDPTLMWQAEATVNPSEIAIGARVRHRTKGDGTVLSVRSSGKSTELLVRFDALGEAWIVFGYGVLEFQQ